MQVVLLSTAVGACAPDTSREQGDASAGGPAKAAAGCADNGQAVAAQIALAKCLALPAARPSATAQKPVTLYLDRSGSMKGFLDPAYPSRTSNDFRAVLDAVIVGLRPAKAYSFGAEVKSIEANLGTLGDAGFFQDRDTRMEEVFHAVTRDTQSNGSHIILGDARRGTPGSSDGQFVGMRNAADAWIAQGGSFLVAASFAPFKSVSSDPSGCHKDPNAAQQKCPLYAFGFIAKGDEVRIAAALASVFENVFAWPTPIIPPGQFTLIGPPARTDIILDGRWATTDDGTPIGRTQGKSATNTSLPVKIMLTDSTSLSGNLFSKLLGGTELHVELLGRRHDASGTSQKWTPIAGGSPLVAAESKGLELRVVTRGALATRSMVHLRIVSDGTPKWLTEFDAPKADDGLRTYGLSRLFESFRQSALQNSREISSLYIVAN